MAPGQPQHDTRREGPHSPPEHRKRPFAACAGPAVAAAATSPQRAAAAALVRWVYPLEQPACRLLRRLHCFPAAPLTAALGIPAANEWHEYVTVVDQGSDVEAAFVKASGGLSPPCACVVTSASAPPIQLTQVGPYAWLALALTAAECLLVRKLAPGSGVFDSPMPPLVRQAWLLGTGGFLAFLAVWQMYRTLGSRKRREPAGAAVPQVDGPQANLKED